VNTPEPEAQREGSSCWLQGCLLAAVVLSASMVLLVIWMLLMRISEQA
jgi:hypothetical protein